MTKTLCDVCNKDMTQVSNNWRLGWKDKSRIQYVFTFPKTEKKINLTVEINAVSSGGIMDLCCECFGVAMDGIVSMSPDRRLF